MPEVELIKFIIPSPATSLYVTDISSSANLEDIRKLFSQFGLLYDIRFKNSDEGESFGEAQANCSLGYCIVVFYSLICAKEAATNLHNSIFMGRKLSVSFTTTKFENRKEFPLQVSKSIELVNFYFGFGGWSSSIESLKKIETGVPEYDEETKEFTIGYRCIIKHYFNNGAFVFGVGEGIETGSTREQVTTVAVKTSITLARKDAFQHIIIIATSSGKVGIHTLENENIILPVQSLLTNELECTLVT